MWFMTTQPMRAMVLKQQLCPSSVAYSPLCRVKCHKQTQNTVVVRQTIPIYCYYNSTSMHTAGWTSLQPPWRKAESSKIIPTGFLHPNFLKGSSRPILFTLYLIISLFVCFQAVSLCRPGWPPSHIDPPASAVCLPSARNKSMKQHPDFLSFLVLQSTWHNSTSNRT